MKALLIIGLMLMFGCNNANKTQSDEITQAERDSFSISKYGKPAAEHIQDQVDSIMKATTNNALFDTAGLYRAPVKVLNSKLFKKEYSNYRDIRLTYKNVSNKTIIGIKFRWKGVDAFGDPADMGSYTSDGFGGGFTDDPLRGGRTETSEWGILSKDGKKVILAWPIEVAFEDGSKWKLGSR